jgi:hypothetical protein
MIVKSRMHGSYRTLVLLAALWLILQPLPARLMRPWSYKEMFEKAELVIIAKPLSSQDTNERRALEELDSPPGQPVEGDQVQAVGVNTKLAALLVLKGDRSITRLTLHHYRLKAPAGVAVVDGPSFVEFNSKE